MNLARAISSKLWSAPQAPNQSEPSLTHTMRIELVAFGIVILVCNLPLLRGACATEMIFLPMRVGNGEWWRVFTHPFVHVSWYHLLLDASAFLCAYEGLRLRKPSERIVFAGISVAGGLLASLWAAPMIQTRGLCGLSGAAHGLTAIYALELIRPEVELTIRRAGWIALALLCGKAAFEAVTGHVLFEGLHFGLIGTPIAVCHAGGVVAGITIWALLEEQKRISLAKLGRHHSATA